MFGVVAGRYIKVWEGQDPFLVLQAQTRQREEIRKCYLTIDAQARKLTATHLKPEGLKPSGSVVNLMRKYAPSGGLGRLLRDIKNGDYWVPLYTEKALNPTYYLHLTLRSPAEISLVSAAGMTLVRRSSKGTYTKSKPWDGLLPHQLEDPSQTYTDVTEEVFGENSDDRQASLHPPAETRVLLPEYQRVARDRLVRRLKTIRRFVANRQTKFQTLGDLSTLERHAQLLATYLHRVRAGDFELLVDGESIALDPEKSPGHNLDNLYVRIKKAKKSLLIDREQIEVARTQVLAMEADLAHLRANPLSNDAVEQILQRHKLPLNRPTQRSQTGLTPVAQAWRIYYWRQADTMIPLMVGKSAAGSDELCRAARSNDWWLHVVGATGSHVVIPARSLAGDTPTAGLIRAGAILALHFSQRKSDLRGEVYLTRRHLIRKRPGMPAGLWQIDQAETIFVSYDETELQVVLANIAPEQI